MKQEQHRHEDEGWAAPCGHVNPEQRAGGTQCGHCEWDSRLGSLRLPLGTLRIAELTTMEGKEDPESNHA